MAETVTDKVKKLRAAKSATVKPGQWHADFSTVQKHADANGIPLLAVWSNGDKCGHCIMFEKCILDSKFKNWQKTCGVDMWIGLGTDTSAEDKEYGVGFKFARKGTSLNQYPFVRLYWKKGKVDVCKTGDSWTGAQGNSKGAEKFVKALKSALKKYCPSCEPTPAPTPAPTPEPVEEYKIRLNEKVTTAQVNAILDSLDANGGYCPCQAKSADTKCHCKDFTDVKKIGEPCICNIYVKRKK